MEQEENILGKEKIGKLIKKFSSNVSIQNDEITTYFSLFLPSKGIL